MMSMLRRFSLWLALAGLVVVGPIPSTHATINSAVNKTIVLGTGAQTQFSFNFVGVASAYISVIFTDANGVETTLTQGSGTTQYQIVLNAPLQGALWGIGGTVTYNPNGSPIANGTTLTIFRTLPLTQAISLQNQISLSALGKGSETGLDTIEMQLQQTSDGLARAITAPIVDPPTLNLVLPPAAQRANTGIAFDSRGNVIAGTTPATGLISSAMQPVVDASSLANGRTAFGLGSMAVENINGGNCGGTSIQDDGSASGPNGTGYARVVNATVTDSSNQAVVCGFHLTQRIATGPITYTLPRANTFFNGFGFWINALSTGLITLAPDPNDSITTNAAGVAVALPASANYFVTTDAAGSGKWYVSRSATAATAGSAPHFTRIGNGVKTTFTPDAGAKLLQVEIVGGGGGGSGNGARNAIGFNQYGGVGNPSGIGGKTNTVTISQASPAVVTWAGHGLTCNDPVYFTDNGDTLPSPLVATQLYYVMCDGSITSNTFEISLILFDVPITCAVYAPRCQTAINTTTPGAGTHIGNAYQYVAFGGYGGGIVGDQANPGGYRGCDSNGPAGYVQSYGLTGSQGENMYIYPGYSIDGGRGGGTPFGGGAAGGVAGIDFTGGGGDGGRPTLVSAGGGSGGGAGYCKIWLQPSGTIPILCGAGGSGGVAQNDAVSISIASPAVITLNSHGFFGGVNPPTTCSVIQFTTTGTLPTGISPATDYFVLNTGLMANSFEISASACGGSAINTSGSQSGTQNVTSGVAGGAGGSGACYITQYFQ